MSTAAPEDRGGRPGVPAMPPPCPEGWVVQPPDFVGVGANRSGTTWWYNLILAHPNVWLAPLSQKELYYFDIYWDDNFTDSVATAYHSYFPRPPGGLAGEWTPDYMYHIWAPKQLAQSAPHTKILVCLRDPFDRYLSELRHWVALGLDRSNLGRVSDLAQARSLFSYPITQIFNYFARDQVLILQHERCIEEPQGQLRRTYEFLDLRDADFLPDNLCIDARINVTPDEIELPRALTDRSLASAFAADAKRLTDIEPEIDLRYWPTLKG
jgi:hypothetical protein